MNPKDTARAARIHTDALASIRKHARPETYSIPTTIRLSAEELAMVARIQQAQPELNGLAAVVREAVRRLYDATC